jgi:predicted O-methyltransferase YrrM
MNLINLLKHKILQKAIKKSFPLRNVDMQGFMSAEDSFFLYSSVLFSRPKSVLEIGHFLGKSTAAICQAIRDAKLEARFDSFDRPYESTEAFEEYYRNIHQREYHAEKVYSNILDRGLTFTQLAQANLANLDLSQYVNLRSQDFREAEFSAYDLIFSDVLHDKAEIDHNIADVTRFGHNETIYLFDDMSEKNIKLIELNSSLKLIRSVGKVGAFRQEIK